MASTAQGGADIVTGGLILYLDAANVRSYPGSGNTWYDLSGQENHFTLFNTPTYTGNTLEFNGTSQYGSCVNTTCGNFGTGSFTIEYVFRPNYSNVTNLLDPDAYACVVMKRAQAANITFDLPGYWFNPSASLFAAVDDLGAPINSSAYYLTNVSPQNELQQWSHTINKGSATLFTASAYKNGSVTTSKSYTLVGTGNVDNNLNMLLMKSYGQNGLLSGSLTIVRAYNRALSAAEIQQNYLALKPRFF